MEFSLVVLKPGYKKEHIEKRVETRKFEDL